ncbi:type 2 lanthipeptide synthetase LanM [Staphylococcus hominis]
MHIYGKIFKDSKTIEEVKSFAKAYNIKDDKELKDWFNIRTLLNEKQFKEVLKQFKMSREEFSTALMYSDLIKDSEPVETWEKLFIEILENFENYTNDTSDFKYSIVNPFIGYAEEKLNILINKTENITISKTVKEKMLHAIKTELFNISGKVLALDYNYFKSNNPDIQSSIFQHYIKNNFSSLNQWKEVFNKYPTLAKLITKRLQFLLNFYKEVISRSDKDYLDIKKMLNIDTKTLKLKNINLSSGDSHNEGRTVCILEFDVGKIVYKPKNLEINKAIDEFLLWFTNYTNSIDIKFPKGIYKENYSYVEFVGFKELSNDKEIENFYFRYGYLIALTYIFNITDIHLENLIAHGEYPVIVDIETSFQNNLPFQESLLVNLFKITDSNSVKASGLLPQSLLIGEDDDNIDLGALKGKQQKLNKKAIIPVGINTDDFHYEKVGQVYGPSGENIPKNQYNEEIDFNDYRNIIVEGFCDFIEKIYHNKELVLRKINEMNNCKIRILLKGTEKYFSMIRFSNHPNYNQKMKYRERFLMNIWSYPYADKRPILSEFRDLIYNDIPIFETFMNSTNLLDSKGRIYENYFKESGLKKVENKLMSLNENEILFQKAILYTSLGLADEYLNKNPSKIKVSKTVNFANLTYKYNYIAEQIQSKMIQYKKNASFINLEMNEKSRWSITPINESLYDGLSGIALMYLFVFIDSRKTEYYDLYKKLMREAIQRSNSKPIYSAFQGYLSPLYNILLEKKYLGKSYFDKEAKNISEVLIASKDKLNNLERIDFISGVSGIISLLISAQKIYGYKMFPKKLLNIFIEIVKQKTEKSEFLKEFQTNGIAHGVSGIVLSLARADSINDSKIIEMLSYEDLIDIPNEDYYKWCNGIVGILHSRIKIVELKPHLSAYINLENIIDKFEKTLNDIPEEDCMCHGSLGIVNTLKELYNYTKKQKWNDYINLIMSNINNHSSLDNFHIKKIYDIYSLGLFDGLSGVALSQAYIKNNDLVNVQILDI